LTDAAPGRPAASFLWGRLSAFGLVVAIAACLIDQASKFWLISHFDLANRGQFPLTRFVALVLTWNTGISYGLFPQQEPIGEWALFAFKVAAVIFMWIWLTRATSRLTATAIST
jgi:signal peptidase II